MNIVTQWFRRSFADSQVVLLVVLLLAALAAIVFFGEMVAPVIGAIVIAFLLDGAAERLRRLGLGNLLAVSIVFIGFLASAFMAMVVLLPPIARQFTQFFTQLPTMVAKVQGAMTQLPEMFPGMIDDSQVAGLVRGLNAELLALGQRALEISVGGITSMLTLAVYLVLVPVMVFFFMKDKEQTLHWLGSFLPKNRPLVDQVWQAFLGRTADYARGKVYEILIVGSAAWVTYWLLDLPYAELLAVVTGLSVIVPYIGATLVTIPVAFVAFIEWGFGSQFATALIAYLILQALDGNVLVPLLFSEVVKLHPNAIILAILIFGGIWGLWGVFFAIPLATLAHAVIKAWPETEDEKLTASPGA